MRWSRLLAAGIVALTAGCSDHAPLITSPDAPPPYTTGYAISDAIHDPAGNDHFFWLPPMVSAPGGFNGPFDAAQSPVVQICDLADCDGRILATYTMTSGPGAETIRRVAEDEHYVVNWDTDAYGLGPGPIHRIRVLVSGTLLGYADVQLAANGGEAKDIASGHTIALVDGRTLPVKFRIEEGAVFVIPAATGGTISALGGSVALQIPPGSLSGDVGITVKSVPPTQGSIATVELGPSGTTFDPANPVTVTLTYDEAALAGLDEDDLALNLFDDAAQEWIIVPGSAVDPVSNAVSAPFFHFSRAGAGPAAKAVFCAGDTNPNTFETMPAAIDAVMAGGTVEICAGTHVVDSVHVTKAVTFESKTGTRPVIRVTTARASFFVDAVTSGLVTFRGIDFENHSPRDGTVSPAKNTYSIRIRDDYDQVLIDDATFTNQPGTTGGVLAFTGGVPGARVQILNSQFTGGLIGFNAVSGPDADISGSSFGGHDVRAVQYINASGTFGNNALGPNCGSTHCLFVTGAASNVLATGNIFTENRTDVDSFRHHVVLVSADATARIEDNDFNGCGKGQCILAIRGSYAEVVNNRFTIDAAHEPTVAVNGSDGSGGTRVPLFPPPTLVVTDNTITGVGAGANGYATIHSGIQAEFGTMLTAYRNTITNTANGISGFGGGIITDARDNVIDNVRTGIGVWNGSQVSARFNDITNASLLDIDIPDSDPALSDLTCNWWGDISGPDAVGGAPGTLFTPWATAAIAGTAAVGCSGGT